MCKHYAATKLIYYDDIVTCEMAADTELPHCACGKLVRIAYQQNEKEEKL